MRRLIRFPLEGDTLSGSLDEGDRTVGLLCVTGGSQIRTGPHRMLHRLALEVAARGVSVFRYDRRGVGDSEGRDNGYKDSGADLAAAVAAFRAEAPHVDTIVGFGLCDGATTLALHGARVGVDVLILANPWLVEVEANTLAPAAARAHYRDRLRSPAAWGSILRGKVNLFGAAKSLLGAVAKPENLNLADEVARGLTPYAGRLALILSRGDGTAIAARSCWNADAFAHLRDERIVTIDTDSHTFARNGDLEPVLEVVHELIGSIEERG